MAIHSLVVSGDHTFAVGDCGIFVHNGDCGKALAKAIEQNVAFVPGAPFYAVDPQPNTLRLSFVTVPQDKIEAGVQILGKLLKAEIATLDLSAVAAA